jgi:dolichol-phosphate mannosyltransferase
MSNIVIIPTFKEKENIEGIISSISSLPVKFDILIIDDNSPDGTANIVKQMQPSHPNLFLIERQGSGGHWKRITPLYMKWMLTSLMIPTI